MRLHWVVAKNAFWLFFAIAVNHAAPLTTQNYQVQHTLFYIIFYKAMPCLVIVYNKSIDK